MDKFFELIVLILESIFKLFGELLGLIFDSVGKRKHAYTADFVSERRLLSRHHTGFCITGRRNLSNKDSYVNALIMGGTGTGKSSVVICPSLMSMTGSFFIHDPAGDLHTFCSGHLVSRGYTVKVLHFSRPEISAQYNPLERVYTSSDIQKIASLLVSNALSSGKEDPFWSNSAIALLCLLITILLKSQPKQFQNLYNVRHLLAKMSSDPHQVDALFDHYADPVLKSEYTAFIASDDKVVSGVLATVRAALNLFADESIAQVTAGDTLDMENFRKKPTAIFIQNGTADARYFAPLTSLLFEQIFASLLKKLPEKDEQDAYLLIDEAATLTLPTLPLFVANARKYRAGSLICVQNYTQLVHSYKLQNAEAIRANCFTKMYFTGQPLDTCKELEDTLGKFEFKDEEGKVILRSLMTADEIRTMLVDCAILICGHHPPIRARLRPYYKRRDFRRYSQLPPAPYTDSACSPLLLVSLPNVEKE